MLPEVTIVELITNIEPSINRKYVWHNKNGKQMLYVQLKKALYRTSQAAGSTSVFEINVGHSYELGFCSQPI